MSDFVICNPTAGRGRALQLLRRNRPVGEIHLTTEPGHATELARAAARARRGSILVFGGDGTAHEVAQGILADDEMPQIRLRLAGGGTSCDLLRSARENGPEVRDVIAIDLSNGTTRYALNSASIGLLAAATERYASSARHAQLLRRLSGDAAQIYAGARTLLTSSLAQHTITIDEQRTFERDLVGLSIVKTRTIGAGMRFAHGSATHDGTAIVALYQPTSRAALVHGIGFAYSVGGLAASRHCELARATRAAVTTPYPQPIEADGERAGETPATFRVLHRRLHVEAVHRDAARGRESRWSR